MTFRGESPRATPSNRCRRAAVVALMMARRIFSKSSSAFAARARRGRASNTYEILAERGGLHLHTRLLIEISEHAIARSIAMCTSVVLSFQASRNDRSRVADLDFEDLSTLPPDQAERSAPLSLKARARTICGDVDSRRRNRRYASRDHPDRDWRNLRDLALVGALLAGSLLFHVTILREEPRRTTEPRTAAGTR